MALIDRIKVRADLDDPIVADVLAELGKFSERLGTGLGSQFTAPDKRDAEALHDLMKAHFNRRTLNAPVKVHRHRCPHVAGFEEASWVSCTDAQYGYQQEIIGG